VEVGHVVCLLLLLLLLCAAIKDIGRGR
jgi:hypothetical protein